MAAGIHELEMNRGATLFRTFRLVKSGKPIDLTGYAARVAVRFVDRKVRLVVDERSAGYLSPSDPATGGLQIDPKNGVITLEVGWETTQEWEWQRGEWWLDVKQGDFVTRVIAGPIIVNDP